MLFSLETEHSKDTESGQWFTYRHKKLLDSQGPDGKAPIVMF